MLIIDFDPSCAKKYVENMYNIVTVDVLRASSTIITALERGAKCVFPCVEVEHAKSFKTTHNCVLIGERGAEIIEGFDYTNSPHDLYKIDLVGRCVAITTSTGTRLIEKCVGAKHILVGSTINAMAVAEMMKELGGKWVIIGAGSHGEFRPEDKVGCALIAKYYIDITKIEPENDVKNFIDEFSLDIEEKIKGSNSTKKLLLLGRECDVKFVVENKNHSNVVPVIDHKESKKIGWLVIK